MKTFIFNVRWNDGSTYSYEVKGGMTGLRFDPITEAKERLNATRSIVAYNVVDEEGKIVYSMGDSDGIARKIG